MFLVLLFLLRISVGAETPNDVETILAEHFSEHVYNKMVRGKMDLTQPTIVEMNFSLVNLDTFDEVKDNLDLMGVIYLAWKDERLTWDPYKYNGTYSITVFQDIIWRPRVVLVNPSKNLKTPGFEYLLARIYYDGTVVWWTGDVFQIKCSADVTSFPFDYQVCGLQFNVWGYTSTEVILMSSSHTMLTHVYTEHGLWTLVETSVLSRSIYDFQYLEFVLIIERNATYFLVNILIPSILLGILSLLVFLLPQESGERISYSITVLLSIGVFLNLVGDHLPANSVKMAAICYFLLALLITSSISCILSIFSLKMFHCKSSPVPKCLRFLSKSRCCPSSKVRQTMANNVEFKHAFKETDQPSPENNDLQLRSNNAFEEPEVPDWQHISNVFDRACLVLLSVIFILSIAMYAFYVVKGRKKDKRLDRWDFTI